MASNTIKNEGSLFITTNVAENELKIEVEDTGEGILEEYRERIFERFLELIPTVQKKRAERG